MPDTMEWERPWGTQHCRHYPHVTITAPGSDNLGGSQIEDEWKNGVAENGKQDVQPASRMRSLLGLNGIVEQRDCFKLGVRNGEFHF